MASYTRVLPNILAVKTVKPAGGIDGHFDESRRRLTGPLDRCEACREVLEHLELFADPSNFSIQFRVSRVAQCADPSGLSFGFGK